MSEPLGYVSKIRPGDSPRRTAKQWACTTPNCLRQGKIRLAVRRPACNHCRCLMDPPARGGAR